MNGEDLTVPKLMVARVYRILDGCNVIDPTTAGGNRMIVAGMHPVEGSPDYQMVDPPGRGRTARWQLVLDGIESLGRLEQMMIAEFGRPRASYKGSMIWILDDRVGIEVLDQRISVVHGAIKK